MKAKKIASRSNSSTSNKKIWPIIRNILIIVLIIAIFIFLIYLPNVTSVDFATLRENISNYGIKQTSSNNTKNVMTGIPQTASETEKLKKIQEERSKYVSESRASVFVESAMNDYYKGEYKDAIRRLERAIIYDPSNYIAYKLCGQIYFEHNQYRKAYNMLEKANQFPNDDKTLARDIEVLRKLLRYSRNEIDTLRHTVHKNPNNKLALAQLKELEERVQE